MNFTNSWRFLFNFINRGTAKKAGHKDSLKPIGIGRGGEEEGRGGAEECELRQACIFVGRWRELGAETVITAIFISSLSIFYCAKSAE